LKEKLKAFGLRSTDVGLNVEDSQVMTIEKTIGLFIGPSMAEVRDSYLKPNLS